MKPLGIVAKTCKPVVKASSPKKTFITTSVEGQVEKFDSPDKVNKTLAKKRESDNRKMIAMVRGSRKFMSKFANGVEEADRIVLVGSKKDLTKLGAKIIKMQDLDKEIEKIAHRGAKYQVGDRVLSAEGDEGEITEIVVIGEDTPTAIPSYKIQWDDGYSDKAEEDWLDNYCEVSGQRSISTKVAQGGLFELDDQVVITGNVYEEFPYMESTEGLVGEIITTTDLVEPSYCQVMLPDGTAVDVPAEMLEKISNKDIRGNVMRTEAGIVDKPDEEMTDYDWGYEEGYGHGLEGIYQPPQDGVTDQYYEGYDTGYNDAQDDESTMITSQVVFGQDDTEYQRGWDLGFGDAASGDTYDESLVGDEFTAGYMDGYEKGTEEVKKQAQVSNPFPEIDPNMVPVSQVIERMVNPGTLQVMDCPAYSSVVDQRYCATYCPYYLDHGEDSLGPWVTDSYPIHSDALDKFIASPDKTYQDRFASKQAQVELTELEFREIAQSVGCTRNQEDYFVAFVSGKGMMDANYASEVAARFANSTVWQYADFGNRDKLKEIGYPVEEFEDWYESGGQEPVVSSKQADYEEDDYIMEGDTVEIIESGRQALVTRVDVSEDYDLVDGAMAITEVPTLRLVYVGGEDGGGTPFKSYTADEVIKISMKREAQIADIGRATEEEMAEGRIYDGCKNWADREADIEVETSDCKLFDYETLWNESCSQCDTSA